MERIEHDGIVYDIMAAGIVSGIYRQENMKRGCVFSTKPDKEQVALCARWLGLYTAPGVKMNFHTYSYGLKHVVEKQCKTYISNGAFILAAKRAGYPVVPEGPRSPNAFFHMAYPLKARQVNHG